MDQASRGVDTGWNAVEIDGDDNVAVALAELTGTATVYSRGRLVDIPLIESIPMGHKFATRAIARGAAVIKYGQAIGSASSDIPIGAHVHVQNVASNRART